MLRGPQGTLFGKNASAGLIHIITARPNPEEWDGYAQAGLGNYESSQVAAGVGGPIVGEKLVFGINGSYAKREDGYIDDIANPGVSYNDRDRYLIRGQFAGQLTESFDYRLIGDYAKRDESCCLHQPCILLN